MAVQGAAAPINSQSVVLGSRTRRRPKICVFCGSSTGTNPAYIEAAQALGKALAEQDIDLVYGGGTIGLMGEVAKTVCSIRGPQAVHGIIPRVLAEYERTDAYSTSIHPTLQCFADADADNHLCGVARLYRKEIARILPIFEF